MAIILRYENMGIVAAIAYGNTRMTTLLSHFYFRPEVIGEWHWQEAHPATSSPTVQAKLLIHK